jgi:ABC-type multidrug transport system fused ATPase/permease subunit
MTFSFFCISSFGRVLKTTLLFYHDGFKCYRRETLVLFALVVGVSIVDFVCPLLTRRLIDVAIPERDIELWAEYAAMIGAAIVLSFLINLQVRKRAVILSEEIIFRLRIRIVESLLGKSPAFFRDFSQGDIFSRFHFDVNGVADYLYRHLIWSGIYLIGFLTFMTLLVFWNWQLGLITLVLCLAAPCIILANHQTITATMASVQEKRARQDEFFLDMMGGVKEIGVYLQKKNFQRRFQSVGEAARNKQIRAACRRDYTWLGLDRLCVMINVFPIVMGGLLLIVGIGDLTLGIVVAFAQCLYYCSYYLRYSGNAAIFCAATIAHINRLNEMLDTGNDPEPASVGIEHAPEHYDIEFCDVSFAYPGGKRVFEKLNLGIKTGEKVAIMAHSGRGKTTLVNLLLRLLRPDSGKICFGGRDIEEYPKNFYLHYFSYVSQNPHIFRESIKDNVDFGWVPSDQARCDDLLKRVGIFDDVQKLPEKSATILDV